MSAVVEISHYTPLISDLIDLIEKQGGLKFFTKQAILLISNSVRYTSICYFLLDISGTLIVEAQCHQFQDVDKHLRAVLDRQYVVE